MDAEKKEGAKTEAAAAPPPVAPAPETPKVDKAADMPAKGAKEMPDEGGYKKSSAMKWILIYVVIAVIIYGLYYYFVMMPKGTTY